MFARLIDRRKVASRVFVCLSLVWLAACDAIPFPGAGGSDGPRIDPSAPVMVALLVPSGSGSSSNDLLASNLENAARLAISDLSGVQIDLRVYATGANPTQAAGAAATAVNEGAKIILGPLYADSANAAAVAVSGSGVNVLAFSNNTTIAGGNVFVLGPTFENTSDRLIRYGVRNGINTYAVAHSDDLQGNIGRDSILAAVRNNGATITAVQGYALSQESIIAASSQIAQAAASADALFLTAGVNADLPILASTLPESGLDLANTRLIGLTRWNAAPQALALPGLQGGLFAIPDQNMTNIFESRYQTAFNAAPHSLAGLAYDGIAAIGALVAQGDANALSRSSLTQAQGFQGTAGIFRLLPNGTNERGLAVATIQNNQVVILDPAPRSFGRAGS